jgi:hypothetical protein
LSIRPVQAAVMTYNEIREALEALSDRLRELGRYL